MGIYCTIFINQDGISERSIQIIVERVRIIQLSAPALSKGLLYEVINISIYLANRLLIKAISSGITPHELFNGIKSIYGYLRIFSSAAYALALYAKSKE